MTDQRHHCLHAPDAVQSLYNMKQLGELAEKQQVDLRGHVGPDQASSSRIPQSIADSNEPKCQQHGELAIAAVLH